MVSGTPNPLVPDATFVVELVIFGAVLAAVARWVLPPLTRAMTARNQELARRAEQVDRATAAAHAACRARGALLARARVDAAGIRADAAAQGRRIVEAARADAAAQARDIMRDARCRIADDQQQAARQLMRELDRWSILLAEKILQQPLDPARVARPDDHDGVAHEGRT